MCVLLLPRVCGGGDAAIFTAPRYSSMVQPWNVHRCSEGRFNQNPLSCNKFGIQHSFGSSPQDCEACTRAIQRSPPSQLRFQFQDQPQDLGRYDDGPTFGGPNTNAQVPGLSGWASWNDECSFRNDENYDISPPPTLFGATGLLPNCNHQQQSQNLFLQPPYQTQGSAVGNGTLHTWPSPYRQEICQDLGQPKHFVPRVLSQLLPSGHPVQRYGPRPQSLAGFHDSTVLSAVASTQTAHSQFVSATMPSPRSRSILQGQNENQVRELTTLLDQALQSNKEIAKQVEELQKENQRLRG